MTESLGPGEAIDPIAIQRWENEGGSALAPPEARRRVVASPVEHVENVILGGGEAGKYIAWELAKQGRPTMVVERALVGGSCPNIACLPSKNIIRSAKVASLVQQASRYGIVATRVGTDMEGVRRRKRAMVDGMIEIHENRFAVPGLEFVLGDGRFVAPRTIEIHLAEGGLRRVVGDRVFLNLGTHASRPDISGLAASQPLSHVEALELEHLPAHLVVLGGGYVGVELAQAFRRFGSQVTIVQRGSQLLPREDGRQHSGQAIRPRLARLAAADRH